ncbi:GpU protein [Anaerobacterium chartisolvens]|uniref:GpU protein n=1 Tax=Anaerobacterium chartisolvens TaxID=1297424 RepID=A0A369BMG1_9FIRM|nr:phage tail protein [Anaerobacterium chartisolvens]RCX20874.1 GpU protein [Anaerobacterium chartisolvens]
MPIAVFANKSFQVSNRKLYTFNEFTTGGALQTEKQDVAGKKPSTYIKGSDLDTMSFNVPLDNSFGMDVREEYESWKTIKDARKAYTFILGNKPFGTNKWLLTSVALSDTTIDKKGNIIKGKLQLQFDEYVRAGSASASKSSSKKSAKGVSAGDKSILDALISGEDKAAQKRTNTNASIAAAAGIKK